MSHNATNIDEKLELVGYVEFSETDLNKWDTNLVQLIKDSVREFDEFKMDEARQGELYGKDKSHI